MKLEPFKRHKWDWKKIFQYFLQGLIVLAPITITVWAVLALFNYIDNILPNLIQPFLPVDFMIDEKGEPRNIPGIGFVLVVGLLVFVGWISSSYIFSKVVEFFGHALERTPGIRYIYTSVKDFLEAFAGDKRKFDKPVLVNVDGTDVWRMGFMTQPDCSKFGMTEHVVVYLPHSYALSGVVYIVPVSKIRLLENISSTDAMKFAVSGGVADITH